MNLFNKTISLIKAEYKTNPNNLGWRFLVTSEKTMEQNNGILFLTLNPGGDVERKDHSSASCEKGAAYFTENWSGALPGESVLQKQVQYLFKEIADRIKENDFRKVLENSLCAYFIPFRSRNIKSLKGKKETEEFAKRIWKEILKELQFKVIMCIDRDTYKYVETIIEDMGYKHIKGKELETGWGHYKAAVSKYRTPGGIVTLARFPHLSRFTIFGRPASEKHIATIIKEIFKDY